MDRTRTNDDEHSVIVASQYACGMVTSRSNCMLGLWRRLNFVAKERRLDERVVLEEGDWHSENEGERVREESFVRL